MQSKWIVQRVEEHGRIDSSGEVDDEILADAIYRTYCDHQRGRNDQSVSLIRIDRTEVVVSRHINTDFNQV